jgi:molecular chaperone GrpE
MTTRSQRGGASSEEHSEQAPGEPAAGRLAGDAEPRDRDEEEAGELPQDPDAPPGAGVPQDPDASPGVDAPPGVDVEAIVAERDEYLDMLRRVQADFENYRKRMLRQQTELLERAAEDIVVKLLPVLDAFQLAREHLGERAAESPEGEALVQAAALLDSALTKEGLERIGEAGDEFDPSSHEAVEHEPAQGEPSGSGDRAACDEGPAPERAAEPVVTGVLRAGYRWKGRVVRPAMVKVRG